MKAHPKLRCGLELILGYLIYVCNYRPLVSSGGAVKLIDILIIDTANITGIQDIS